MASSSEFCRISYYLKSVSDEEMQEFRRVGFSFVELAKGIIHSGTLDFLNSSLPPQPVTDLQGTVEELGNAGWELLSHKVSGAMNLYYFQRPR